MSSNLLRCFLLSLLLLPLVGSRLPAQATGGGYIQGTVKDATQAAVPGAKISMTHEATGIVTRSVSNSEGFFRTPSLSIGKYLVRVEFTGMKNWEGELTLETGRTAEVTPVLSPGNVTETVTVTEVVPLVTTTEPTDGSTLDAKRIQELPIIGPISLRRRSSWRPTATAPRRPRRR